MKKLFSLVLCLALVLGVVGSSLAAVWFNYRGSEKKDFKPWTNGISQPSTSKNWSLSWTYYHLTPTNRAVIRVYTAGDEVASSTWVYSTPSTKVHPYKKAIAVGTNVLLKGRMDNRDNGEIIVGGYLHP